MDHKSYVIWFPPRFLFNPIISPLIYQAPAILAIFTYPRQVKLPFFVLLDVTSHSDLLIVCLKLNITIAL